LLDFSHTPEQIYEKLQPHGEGFAPRRAGSYTPEQLDLIWNGRPISVEGPEEIARILQREGPGSQGLVIVERTRPINVPEGGVFGHVLNAQNGNGLVDFVDRTHMLGNVSEIQNWFFFPIQ
jgi:hypothetical protein